MLGSSLWAASNRLPASLCRPALLKASLRCHWYTGLPGASAAASRRSRNRSRIFVAGRAAACSARLMSWSRRTGDIECQCNRRMRPRTAVRERSRSSAPTAGAFDGILGLVERLDRIERGGLGPRRGQAAAADRPGSAVSQRALRVRHDQRLIVFERGAEPVARGARAAWVVEREELWRRGGSAEAVVRALETFGESQGRGARDSGRGGELWPLAAGLWPHERNTVSIPLPECRAQ